MNKHGIFSKKFNAGKAKKLNDDSNDAPDDEVETDTLPEDEIISDDMGMDADDTYTYVTLTITP